jgi:GLPGLI family protein
MTFSNSSYGSVEITYKKYSIDRADLVQKMKSNKENAGMDIVNAIDTTNSRLMQLVVDNDFSMFEPQEEEKEIADDEPQIVVVSDGYTDEYYGVYKDRAINKMKISEDFLGEKFLIADTLLLPKWTITKETKMILGKKCTKAVLGKVTAWYCSDVPITDGPDVYWGLPGLIVSLNDGNNDYECQSIIFKSDKKVVQPVKGKKVTKSQLEGIKKKEFEGYEGK